MRQINGRWSDESSPPSMEDEAQMMATPDQTIPRLASEIRDELDAFQTTLDGIGVTERVEFGDFEEVVLAKLERIVEAAEALERGEKPEEYWR